MVIILFTFLTNDQTYIKNNLVPPGFEPGPLRVLDARDNHYTTEL